MANKNGRPIQPKCPDCGKALYKSMEPQQVKKDWPYAFCRNQKCLIHGDIREHGKKVPGQQIIAQGAKKPSVSKTHLSKAHNARKTVSKSSPKATPKQKVKAQKTPTEGTPAPSEKMIRRPLCETCGRIKCSCGGKSQRVEAESITKARGQIRQAIEQNKSVIGLVLIMLAQELGNNAIANQLIDEYELAERFGISKKQEENDGQGN